MLDVTRRQMDLIDVLVLSSTHLLINSLLNLVVGDSTATLVRLTF
jgi:hypothetical protein